jgi:hypothetical protein
MTDAPFCVTAVLFSYGGKQGHEHEKKEVLYLCYFQIKNHTAPLLSLSVFWPDMLNEKPFIRVFLLRML